jgi:hypothetical protein
MGSTTLSPSIAAQLSQAAYTDLEKWKNGTLDVSDVPILPEGWQVDLANSRYGSDENGQQDKSNQFITFFNTETHEVVVAFKGTNNVENGVSDINPSDFGYSQWESVHLALDDILPQIK